MGATMQTIHAVPDCQTYQYLQNLDSNIQLNLNETSDLIEFFSRTLFHRTKLYTMKNITDANL